MFSIIHGEVIDYDLNLLAEILAVIDRQVDVGIRRWKDLALAESAGVFDTVEHVTGLGFGPCQAYLTATYGFLEVAKPVALSVGPRHREVGLPIAEIVNHAANYWKHRDEWDLGGNSSSAKRVRDAFDTLGFRVDSDYPLCGILNALAAPQPSSFAPLIAKLTSWREAVRRISAVEC